ARRLPRQHRRRLRRHALADASAGRGAGAAVILGPFGFDLRALDLQVLLWPLLFGLGAYLLLTAQPIGRPKPDLAERLRRLDVDERIKMELERRDVRPIFASRVLESMLRPLLEDLGRVLRVALGSLGLAGGEALERKL